ncbi:MAG: hypothetical protein ACE5HJ_02730 [Thermoplasmata archaeon]
MPRSALAVARTLKDGPLTREQVKSRTGLPDRTLRFAIARLRRVGIVDERRSLRDARRKLFFLVGEGEGAGRRAQEAPQLTR